MDVEVASPRFAFRIIPVCFTEGTDEIVFIGPNKAYARFQASVIVC